MEGGKRKKSCKVIQMKIIFSGGWNFNEMDIKPWRQIDTGYLLNYNP